MVVFGIIGYFMREMDYPIAPLVLGIILGTILDKNLIRSLIISEGHPLFFIESPISMVIAGVTFITFFSRTRWFQALKSKAGDAIRSKVLRSNKPG
jgi:putative tricarboxylic transport membrane protein